MIRSKSSITLAVKVLLPIFIGSFLILAVGGLYLKVHFEREITLQIRQRAESIAKSINQFAQIDPLSSRLQRFLVAMSKDEEIEAIAIVGHLPQIAILMTDGSEIMKSNQSFEKSVDSYIGGEEFFQKVKEGKAVYGILENKEESDHDFLYIFPTHIKSSKEGKDIAVSIFVQIEATPLIHGFERQLIRSAMFLVLGMLFLGLLNYNVFNFYVFRPVQNIKQAINRRARGDTTAYATQLPGDEIGEVGNALNTMLDALGANRLELIEKTNLLNAIIENMPVSFFAKDVRDNYRIIFWNKKSEELFGIQASEVLGKTDFDFFTKEIAEKYRVNDMNVVSKGGISDTRGKVMNTPRGTWIARTVKAPVFDAQGIPHIIIGIVEDITERKKQQDALRAAKDAAVTANTLKSEFLANMSHELRTPMHSIITFSRQGIERIEKWSLPEHEENLRLIKESGERLLLLLNDLLDLSKLEAKAVEYSMKPQDMKVIVHQVIRQLQPLIEEKKLVVVVEGEAVPLVECDAGKITQVFVNLLSNAVKFSEQGKAIRINLAASNENRPHVLVTVDDQGVGIPEAELEGVFDKFIQSSKTKTGAGGTGLGLAICKEIAIAHQGKIWAENNDNGGARLSLLLPVLQQAEAS